MINEQLELVSDFHTLFEQPILNKEDEIPVERRKLRLALLFEELTELAEAYGVKQSFNQILYVHLVTNSEAIIEPGFMGVGCNISHLIEDTNILNKKEVLDASCDLQYILCGTILENGQQNEFDEAFEDVHKSNISKLCTTTQEVIDTRDKYSNEGIETYSKNLGPVYKGVYRKTDNKVLKSINYKPVELEKYV